MAAVGGWQLPKRIIELSESKDWANAVKEWRLSGIELLEEGEYEKCLCGHTPIRELCTIVNRRNYQVAIVGNVCIQKFDAKDPAHAIFGMAPLIFQAAQRILAHPRHASANEALIKLAGRCKIFSSRDMEFYYDIWRKQRLTPPQEQYKARLNHKLLLGIIWSAKKAFGQVRLAPGRASAGPKLIKLAHQKRVFADKDRDFYLRIWDRSHNRLTLPQQQYKAGLNRRLIDRLQGDFV